MDFEISKNPIDGRSARTGAEPAQESGDWHAQGSGSLQAKPLTPASRAIIDDVSSDKCTGGDKCWSVRSYSPAPRVIFDDTGSDKCTGPDKCWVINARPFSPAPRVIIGGTGSDKCTDPDEPTNPDKCWSVRPFSYSPMSLRRESGPDKCWVLSPRPFGATSLGQGGLMAGPDKCWDIKIEPGFSGTAEGVVSVRSDSGPDKCWVLSPRPLGTVSRNEGISVGPDKCADALRGPDKCWSPDSRYTDWSVTLRPVGEGPSPAP